MKYASNNIRNILIAGHAGSGKTTLTEALVYFSGAAERMGRVEDGTTISDFDPEEAKRKASLSASVVPVEYEGIKYNLIDAPGLFDFEAGEYEGIRAAESVLVCVSGRSGVTVGAEKAFQLARKNGKATMVFISKCDLENANYFKILEEMKIKFGSTVCPCVVPAKLDDGTPVYINLFSQKAFKYESGKQIQVELPDIGHRFQGLIEAMSEAIAETDDELMEKFFGGEPFTTEEIVEGMRKGVKDGLITPVFCGSAVNQQALDMLLFNMHKLLPSPQHDAAILAEDANGEPVELHCDETEPTAAYVFKTVADPFVGKLSYLRVISGKVTGGAALVNARTGETEKIGKPLTVIGKKQVETDGIGAGDIGAVAKLVSAKTGDTLCTGKHQFTFVEMPLIHWPDNMLTYDAASKVVFSNDAFGQHIVSFKLFDEAHELSFCLEKAKEYYANIVMPYGAQVSAKLRQIKEMNLDIEMIAPAHGIIWKRYIPQLLEAYEGFATFRSTDKAVIVYESVWNHTRQMAEALAEGMADQGMEVKVYLHSSTSSAIIMKEILDARVVLVGSGCYNAMSPEISGFIDRLASCKIKGKKALGFGAYGWFGNTVKTINERLQQAGFTLALDDEALSQCYTPSESDLERYYEAGRAIAKA